jgi:AbrB family looped-hinge helix DNA binding protein
MAVVTVKNKYQVVIPQDIRRQVNIRVGDFLEASVERGKITLTPKLLVDREIAEGLADLKEGRTHGPFDSAEEMIAALHSLTAKRGKKKASRR